MHGLLGKSRKIIYNSSWSETRDYFGKREKFELSVARTILASALRVSEESPFSKLVLQASKMILYYVFEFKQIFLRRYAEYNEQFVLFPLHLYILFSAAASISNHRSSKLKYLKANVYKMSFSQQIADVYRISIYFLCFVCCKEDHDEV